MRRVLPGRPSPAMVVACLALIVALGGTSVAAVSQLARNSVGTPQLRNGAVATPKLRNNAVTSAKVRNRSLRSVDFRAGQLPAGPAGPACPAGPAGAAGPAGPSDAYARFLNGPVAVPGALTTLANLSIPQAGNYVVFGKAYFVSTVSGVVTCRLVAGADFDQTQTFVTPTAPFAIALNVVHVFAAAGSVDFSCSATGTQQANFIKISAIRVGNLANTG
ncbi:MAG: hypothetical protein ACRELC_10795 [Gemmatimonadota bacterium]